jgi:hypothetical protein
VNPRIQTEIVPGDVVQSGILISNSEVGLGSVTVMPLILRLVCSNGMIAADNGTRKFHVGRLNEADSNFQIYQSETIEADDKAFTMKLRDTVRATADLVQFERMVNAMRTATEAHITGDIPQVVELASKDFGIRQDESKGILDQLIRGETPTLYGLANAVTRHAQDDAVSYDRSTALEATAWNILNMPRTTWERLNKTV